MHLNIRSDCEIPGVLSIWCFKKCEMFGNCFRIKARFLFVWKFNGKHVLFYEPPSGRANRCLNRCRPLVPFLWDFRSPPPPKHVRRKHPSPARHKNWFVCVWARGGSTWACKRDQSMSSTFQIALEFDTARSSNKFIWHAPLINICCLALCMVQA